MKLILTIMSLMITVSTVHASAYPEDECGSPIIENYIAHDWEFFKNANDEMAQVLFTQYKGSVVASIKRMESSVAAIKVSKTRAFSCYEVAEILAESSKMSRDLSLIFLLNRPGKSCFRSTKEEASASVNISEDGTYYNPLTALANICGARGDDSIQYSNLIGKFDKMGQYLSDLQKKFQKIEAFVTSYEVRSKK